MTKWSLSPNKGLQGLILKINNMFYHIYKHKRKNHIIISITAEKPLRKFNIHS